MEYIISTDKMSKRFKKQLALNEVSIHIKKGEIYGLIGKNGAGKTTFLKIISGLLLQSEGNISIGGYSGDELQKQEVFAKVGSLIENPGLYLDMTGYNNLKMKCICYGIKENNYIENLLQIVGLNNVGNKKVKGYSLGMKQRLGIAMALIGDPEILVLDEPINGLDPQGVVEVRDVISRLNKEKNITIVISSHILEELSKIATNYGILSNGVLIEEISKDNLFSKCSEKIEILVNNMDKTIDILNRTGIKNYEVISEQCVHVLERFDQTGELNKSLVDAGVMVKAIYLIKGSLEEYYFNLLGEK